MAYDNYSTGAAPDYLVIGHVTKDLLAGISSSDSSSEGASSHGSYVPGGTVTYAALTAQRLGLQAAIVTACRPEDIALLAPAQAEGIWVHALASPHTTAFRNIYDERGQRTQFIAGQASPLRYEHVPPPWRAAPIVHLGPVAQELPPDLPQRFLNCLLGITPQGWMRSWQNNGRVEHSAYPVPPALRVLPANTVLVLSIEDLGHDPALLEVYTGLAPLVVVTQGARNALVYRHSEGVEVPAFPAQALDPTGAGDVFAAALFVRYRETGDPVQAARFAHAAAAWSIEGAGTSTIPRRKAVELRMSGNP
jgi:sugar/nucleoside kinase (ribokinase family)